MTPGVPTRLGLLLVLLWAGPASADHPAPDAPAWSLLLVELRLNGQRLADFEDALQTPDGRLWLPLEPLIRVAEGNFERPDTDRYRVTLGVMAEDVRIDLNDRTLQVNGSRRDWPGDGILRQNGQLFLDQTQLQALFGLDVALADNGLRVDVDSARPLPADLRRLRERRWQRFGRQSVETERRYREVSEPYRLWGTPRGDLRLSMNASKADARIRTNASGTIEVEAGYLSNRVFFSGDEREGLRSLRWTGGRSSPEGQAFGIDGLYRLEVGDVSPFRLPLVGGGSSGRGLTFSTAPLSRPELFDVIRIEGDALPGWDAELYRGAELIDFQSIGADGRYDFDDVPLGYGGNLFRVVLYGPQGQVQEREFRRAVAGGQLVPGELHLRGSLVQTDRPMFRLDDRRRQPGEQLSLRADYGLLPRLTASALLGVDREPWSRHGRQQPGSPLGLNAGDEPSLRRTHAGVALRPALGNTRSELVLLQQDSNGTALQADTALALWGTSVSAGYSRYDSAFVSRQREVAGRLFDERLRLRASRGLGQLGPLNLGSLALEYDRYNLSDGGRREEYGSRWRHRVAAVNLSHEIDQIRQNEQISTRYRLLGSYRHGPLTSRAQLQAAGRHPSDLTVGNLSGALDYRLRESRTVGGSLSYSVQGHSYSLGGRFSQQFGAGQVGLSGSINDAGDWAAGLSLSIGLGKEPAAGLSLMPPGHAGAGALAVRVFEDLDGTGEFDPERDRPMPGVGFLVNGRPHPTITDHQGLAVLRPLSIEQPVQVALDPDAMNDPFLTTASPRVRLQARPGHTQQLDMPLLDSAFASGTVTQHGRPLPGVTVIARRDDGLAEETTRSLSDGYFAFETLSPGRWTLAVDPGELPEGWDSSTTSLSLAPGEGSEQLLLQVIPPAEADQP